MDKYTKIRRIGFIIGLVIFVGLVIGIPIAIYNTPVENPYGTTVDTTSVNLVDTIEVDSIK